MTNEAMTAGDAIRYLVNQKGLSRYRIAKDLGISPIQLDNYLAGRRPRPATADKFWEVFGLKITNCYVPKKV